MVGVADPPLLVVVSGLLATGKSTIAEAVAAELRAPVFSVDPLEATLWRAGIGPEQRSGYAAYDLLETLADAQLGRRQSAVLDAVSAHESIREAWRRVAARHGAPVRTLVCACRDPVLHRRRLEARRRDIAGWPEPTWEEVEEVRARFEPWADEHLVLDAVDPAEDNVRAALDYVRLGPRR